MRDLLLLTQTLQNSRFVKVTGKDDWSLRDSFVRRLDKFCEYQEAIRRLVKAWPLAKRSMPGDTSPHRWAEGPLAATGAHALTLSQTLLDSSGITVGDLRLSAFNRISLFPVLRTSIGQRQHMYMCQSMYPKSFTT